MYVRLRFSLSFSVEGEGELELEFKSYIFFSNILSLRYKLMFV